jgi:hypothetical protein
MEVAAQPHLFSQAQPTSSFPHPPVFTITSNSFRFINLHTLSPDGNSLLFSFQELTHTFLSHGTGYPRQAGFPLSIFQFPLSVIR